MNANAQTEVQDSRQAGHGHAVRQQLISEQQGKSYARTIEVSRRVRWEIEKDVIRGREFDLSRKFLPDGLSMVADADFLTVPERRFFSQVQGRTYANMFGLVERFITSAVLDNARDYVLGDQVALEALVRFTEEELKHQELFRRLEKLAAAQMPAGYIFTPDPDAVAKLVLSKSNWAVLGVTLHIELFTQVHYRQSIASDGNLSDLWKDVFLYHWKEESQHAILDELEWIRADGRLSPEARDVSVTELIELVAAIDGLLQVQAQQDTSYFVGNSDRAFTLTERNYLEQVFLKAYRWQYIVSGVQLPRFQAVLERLITPEQATRIAEALTPIVEGQAE